MAVHHGKLYHRTPGWVPSGARFHVRMSVQGTKCLLTDSSIAPQLLESARFYHQRGRWYSWVFLLMPDHLHAVIAFPPDVSMSRTIGDWKHYQEHTLGIGWQDGYFDHRLRHDDEFEEKCAYIRMNPVRQELCAVPEAWPWVVEPWKDAGV